MPRPRIRVPAGSSSGAPRFVAYYRVSTDKQGRSGLGLEAQKATVGALVAQGGGRLVGEYEEVESGKLNARPQLAAALVACRTRGATLVIAKLDRLARNAHFLLSIVEGSGEGGVVFCDLPQVPPGPVGKFLITQMAAVAELEAGLISQRTKAALAAAKARGVKLGGPRIFRGFDGEVARRGRASQTARSGQRADEVLPYIRAAQAAGCQTLREIAAALTARGIKPPMGGDVWHTSQVFRILARARAKHDLSTAPAVESTPHAGPRIDAPQPEAG
jgi:DNA invertase Pin-like site-specific DNA recombinase